LAFAKLGREGAPRERNLMGNGNTMQRFNDDVAAYRAMLDAGFKRRPKLSRIDYARRLAVAKRALAQHYCAAFALWRSCERALCRRRESCCGEAGVCLKRGLDRVPPPLQRRVRQAVVKAMPHNLAAPEREARLCLPEELCFTSPRARGEGQGEGASPRS
jgi:hypothetical protein